MAPVKCPQFLLKQGHPLAFTQEPLTFEEALSALVEGEELAAAYLGHGHRWAYLLDKEEFTFQQETKAPFITTVYYAVPAEAAQAVVAAIRQADADFATLAEKDETSKEVLTAAGKRRGLSDIQAQLYVEHLCSLSWAAKMDAMEERHRKR